MKMTFQEIRIIATGPCIANQLRDVYTICRRSWYIAAHVWKNSSYPLGNIMWVLHCSSAKERIQGTYICTLNVIPVFSYWDKYEMTKEDWLWYPVLLLSTYIYIYNAVHPDRIHYFTNDPDKKYKISFIDNYVQFSLEAQLYTDT